MPVPVSADFVDRQALKQTATGSNGYGDTHPYSQIVYDNSPLPDNVLEQYGPGAAWQTAGKSLKTEYTTNTASGEMSCKMYEVTGNGELAGGTANYPAKSL